MKGLISCRVACRFYDIPTGKCRLKCEEKADPNADFYDDCPLPDAEEVKHGMWQAVAESEITGQNPEFAGHDPTGGYKCSRCGRMAIYDCNDDFVLSAYCPNCGAKMDGGENDGK